MGGSRRLRREDDFGQGLRQQRKRRARSKTAASAHSAGGVCYGQMGCLGEDGGQRYESQNGSGESSVRMS